MPGFDQNVQEELARKLKQEAERLGFEACGIAEAKRLDEEALRLEQWLLEGRHATMSWMERNFEKRVDPRRLVDDAKVVISLVDSYYQPTEHSEHPEDGKISRYAWGDDYHRVMKDKMYRLFHWLDDEAGGVNGRVFVDSAPVLDRVWAQRSGIGWQGKHTLLLNRQMGSFFFIGELIVDIPLPPDEPHVEDFCGSCTRCIDACPTDAIYEPYALDANRCISYLTIEHGAEAIPDSIKPDMGNWIFGCDICQDVCPWNKFRKETNEQKYLPREGVTDTELESWLELDLDEFERIFEDSPVKRATFEGFKRNVEIAVQNARRS